MFGTALIWLLRRDVRQVVGSSGELVPNTPGPTRRFAVLVLNTPVVNITSSGSRVLAVLALGAVTLTGCGSSGSSASGDSADATASPTGHASSGSASPGAGGSSPTMSPPRAPPRRAWVPAAAPAPA